MNNKPIIVIDDDEDDLQLIKDGFHELQVENEIICFNDGYKFLDFIKKTENHAFFTLCDINMSKLSGLELKQMVHDDVALRMKGVPFIFLSTSRASSSVMRAYSYGVQGYFVKPATFEGILDLLQSILAYWRYSELPSHD
jgi:CheY-like chemotaxis protein